MIPEMLPWLRSIARDVRDLRRSRRWRIGDAVVNLLRTVLLLPKRETALDRIERVVDEFRAWDTESESGEPSPYEVWLTARAAERVAAQAEPGPGPLVIALIDGTGATTTRDAWQRSVDGLRSQRWERWRCRIISSAVPDPVLDDIRDDRRFEVVVASDPAGWLDGVHGDSSGDHGGAEWLLPLQPGDIPDPSALAAIVERARTGPDAVAIYGDQDTTDSHGRRRSPWFKPAWNRELTRSTDAIGFPVALRLAAVHRVGGLRGAVADAGIYDLLLRLIEDNRTDDAVVHVAEILGSRLSVPGRTSPADTLELRRRAAEAKWLTDHLGRIGEGRVQVLDSPVGRRICYPLPDPAPSVDIIIPTRDRLDLLAPCVESVRALTDYPDYRIRIVDNGSELPATAEWLASVGQDPMIDVRRDDGPFNFARLNNDAIADCTGDVVVLLNNDTEVLATGWLTELVTHAVRPDVGVVGCMLLYRDGTIQHAGLVLGPRQSAVHVHTDIPWTSPGYAGRAQLAQELSAVTGACLATRRAVWDELGGLDETFASDFNDVDYCLRARDRGYRVIYTPHARLTHHESATRGQPDPRPEAAAALAEFRKRWQSVIDDDPAYHPLLSRHRPFGLPGAP